MNVISLLAIAILVVAVVVVIIVISNRNNNKTNMNEENKKTNTENKKTGSIANLISMLGIIGLTIFVVIGFFLRQVSPAASVVVGLIICAAFALAVYFMTKAKTTDNVQENKWKIVEYSLLVAYIIGALIVFPTSKFDKFFKLIDNKDSIIASAEHDLNIIQDSVNSIVKYYKDTEEKINSTLETANKSYNCSKDVRQYINEDRFSSSVEPTINGMVNRFPSEIERKKKDIYNSVKSFNPFLLVLNADKIDSLATHTCRDINFEIRKIGDNDLPIMGNKQGRYEIIGGYEHRKMQSNDLKTNFQYREKIEESHSGVHLLAFLCYILLHIFILFSYLMANRANVLKAGKNRTNDRGQIINIK